MLLVCALALAAVQGGAVGPLKKRSGSALAIGDTVSRVWYASSCDPNDNRGPHDWKPNKCHKWDGGISFRVTLLTGSACTAETPASVSYWAANAACEGQATSTIPIQLGTCTTVGPLSFLLGQDGVPASALCSFMETMLKADAASDDFTSYLYTNNDCSGQGAEIPNEDGSSGDGSTEGVDEPEASSTSRECGGCCPSFGDSGLVYKKERMTCGKDGIFQASAEYSDALCQNLIANTETSGFMGQCESMGGLSAKTVVSEEFTSAVCTLVDLMKEHSFTDDEWTTPEGIKAVFPSVGDIGTYEGGATLTISSVILLLATCLALA